VTDPGPARPFRRLAVGGIIAIGLGAGLSACGNNGTALAKQACTHVNLSLSLLHRSGAGTDQAESATLKEQALVQLLTALPIAAQAAGQDEQWQALMTTISESNRVPETTLVDALTAQCRLADSSAFNQPPPPSSIPPPDVGPSP
jgi:hypothetical protein